MLAKRIDAALLVLDVAISIQPYWGASHGYSA